MARSKFKIITIAAILLFIFSCYFYDRHEQQRVSGVSENSSSSSTLSLNFFDVGQGDSSLIITPSGQDILIDGGPDNKVLAKLGQALPFYDQEIELLILSHPHGDHLTGLLQVLFRYQVDKIIMSGVVHTSYDYLEFLKLIKEKNIPVQIIDRTQELTLEPELKLFFLFPDKSLAGERLENLNNSSVVFKLLYASTSALFTGDFEDEEILASSSLDLRADILKVGHHGSTNANSQSFLAKVKPQFAVISVGRDNQYGLPGYRTVYELKKLGADVLRTDEMGDIKFKSDGRGWQLLK